MPHLPAAALGPYQTTGTCAEAVEETEEGGAPPTIPVHQRMPTQHGTTEPASRYFPRHPSTGGNTAHVPATSGRNTATKKSSVNRLAHGGQPADATR